MSDMVIGRCSKCGGAFYQGHMCVDVMSDNPFAKDPMVRKSELYKAMELLEERLKEMFGTPTEPKGKDEKPTT